MDLGLDMDELSFGDYCIVCDRAIIPPKETELEVAKTVKKKAPAGTIRIKNPDGTVTTRTANGQKTTRPPLRRGPNSANRLAAVAAANNNAACKLQPLTRSKTAEPTTSESVVTESSITGAVKTDSPETTVLQTPSSTKSEPAPYISSIYCSRACAQVEATRSSDFARKLSYDLGSPSSLRLITSNLPMSGTHSGDHYHRSPAPPSPLYISGSDTSSHSDPQSANPTNVASSAPNANGFAFFNMGRDGADDAWLDVNRQRRSSVHPTIAVRPVAMAREPSQASTTTSGSIVGQSSDSLNSLWAGHQEGDVYLGRSTSGSGRIRMTPMTEYPPSASQNQNHGSKRSMSTSSDRAVAVPVRPLPRSSLSQVSLTAGESSPIPPEFGSAPGHTLSLWNSYHNSFSHREGLAGTPSTSRRPSRGASSFAAGYPGPALVGSTPKSPGLMYHTPVQSERRGSTCSNSGSGSGLQRPLGGTIRAKSRTDVTWDSFGRDEVLANKKRMERLSNGEHTATEHTPKQSIEIGQKGCMIRYHSSSHDLPTRSHSVVSTTEETYPGALSIPRPSTSVRSTDSPARTPTRMLSPSINRASAGRVPDLAALRAGANGCAIAAAIAHPYTSNEHALSTSVTSSTGTSVPRSNWNWDKWEKEGGKTYEVPKGLKQGTGKAGLFFFKS